MSAAPFLKFATVAFIGAPMQRLRIIAVIAGRWLAIMRTSLFSQQSWLPIWVQTVPIPTNEAQVRPLTDLEPEQQRKVWLQAVNGAPMGKVTALNVEAAKAHMIATGKLAKREERRKREEDGRELARLKAKSA